MKNKSSQVVSMLMAALAAVVLTPSALFAAGNAAGKKVYLDSKCNKCHSMDSEKISKLPKDASAEEDEEEGGGAKIEPKDLSKLDDAVLKAKGTPEESLKAWLKKEVAVAFKDHPAQKHKKQFNGSDADLNALVQFLLGK